jgi:hypothetical protein
MKKPIDKLIKGLRDEEPEVPRLAAVRDQVIAGADRLPFHRGHTRGFLQVVAVLSIITFIVGGTAIASQGAAPGDLLYPVKRFTENVFLNLQMSPDEHMRVRHRLIERRFSETTSANKPESWNRAAEEYAHAVRSASFDVSASADQFEPDVTSAHADSLNDMLDDQADAFDSDFGRETLDEAYADAIIRSDEATLHAEDMRLNRDIDADGR